jgi:hypothetical protein
MFEDLRGTAPTREKWNLLLDRLESLQLRSGTGIRIAQNRLGTVITATAKPTRPNGERPMWAVYGMKASAGSFKVNVEPGFIVERIAKNAGGGADSLAYTEPANLFDEEDEPAEFTVEAGQAVFVKVNVLPTGAIGIAPGDPPEDPPLPPVEIVVAPEDQASTHYIPAIGGAAGSAGAYYYKLADIIAGEDEGDLPTIEQKISGGPIDHFAELPTFENAGGASIWKEFVSTTGKYKSKGLTATSPFSIVDLGNTLNVQGDGGDLNLEIAELQYDNDGHIFGSETVSTTLYFRSGVFIGITAPAGDPPAGLITRRVNKMISAA